MSGIIESLLPNINDILGIRDAIGAGLYPVYFLTRTWSGAQVGDGIASDTLAQLLPTPNVKEFTSDVRLTTAGAVKQGDILLSGISKQSYPNVFDVDCTTDALNIERFYFMNDWIYTIVTIKDGYLTWGVLLRKRTDQSRYEI